MKTGIQPGLKQTKFNWRNCIMEQKYKFSRQRRVSFLAIVAVSCLVIAFASPAYAVWQNGSGGTIYGFTSPTDIDIWDISGTYSDSFQLEGYTVKLYYTITQDTGGKLTGTGTASTLGYEFASFDVKGTVGTKNGAASVKMNLKGKGALTDGGESIKVSFSANINAQVISASNTISGTVKARGSALGHSGSTTETFDKSLPADMNGSSTLDLGCNPSGKSLLGKSMLTLSNGKEINFDVKGKYNLKKDETTLTLKGDKNKLKMKINGTDGSIKSVKGKVLGQKIAI
jgi:hypothetical protein